MSIQQLSPSVINKIAAGEVIERPASVVKELVENSIDAGATRIEVSLEKGGADLVRVADDGRGVAAEQLPLAVASHATSKIADADDLFRVRTLGFRGEALASIAEVSHFSIRSRTSDSTAAAELEVRGGNLGPAAPCGGPVGSVVEVRNLFFNTPVRRKFLRTTQTEMGHSSEAFTRLALAHPHIHFTLRHNERTLHDLPATNRLQERIAALFDADLAAGLIPIESQDSEIRLAGYVADPQFSRGNNRMQYLFLNGRYIRDRALGHALGEAYRGLLLTGRYPICFLRLELPPDLVDVNVHPTKLEVRFQDSGRLYSQLLGTLRTKFLTTDLTARVRRPAAENGENAASASDLSEPAAAHDAASADDHRRQLVEWAKGQLSAAEQEEDPRQSDLELQYEVDEHNPLELTRLSRSWGYGEGAEARRYDHPHTPQSPAEETAGAGRGGHRPSPSNAPMQVHNRYLITESDDGMVVIDQHALHERVLYEQLREKVLAGDLETQRLLAPEPISLTPQEAAAVLDRSELLGQLGLVVEPFGGDCVVVSAYPAMLANLDPAGLVRTVAEQLMEGGKKLERRDLLDELLHMISCKAAIKAGDRLAREEVEALLRQRHLFHDTHHCPHGRPTALVFTREELDRRFQRT